MGNRKSNINPKENALFSKYYPLGEIVRKVIFSLKYSERYTKQ